MPIQIVVGILAGAVLLTIMAAMIIIRSARARNPDVIEARLAEYVENPISLEKLELEQPFTERVLKPLVNLFARIMGTVTPRRTQERLRRNLQMAGHPNGLQAGDFLALRLLAAIL